MRIKAKYAHTNLIAEDWRALAGFYQEMFGCIPVPPERDYHGADLDLGSGLHGAHLTGAHLRLPGYGDDGPTIEIFNYSTLEPRARSVANRPGYGHIAFGVDDVEAAQEAVLAAGGRAIGEVVTLTTSLGTKVTWCYVTDPEDNIVELQSWSKGT